MDAIRVKATSEVALGVLNTGTSASVDLDNPPSRSLAGVFAAQWVFRHAAALSW